MVKIEHRLAEAGYRLLSSRDINDMILELLESKERRYLRAIPVLIYRHDPDIPFIFQKTKKKELFGQILGITARIFMELGIDKSIPLPETTPVSTSTRDYDDFKEEFKLQITPDRELAVEKQRFHEERDLQMWLSRLFTKKEKWIIMRVLFRKPISKSDYEYYSRKTKKKLNSISNLKDFATTIYNEPVLQDNELFIIKKNLMHLLSQWKFRDAEIISYAVSKNNLVNEEMLAIQYRQRGEHANFVIRLTKIKDRSLVASLRAKPTGDFR
jgi:hypothetical protein